MSHHGQEPDEGGNLGFGEGLAREGEHALDQVGFEFGVPPLAEIKRRTGHDEASSEVGAVVLREAVVDRQQKPCPMGTGS